MEQLDDARDDTRERLLHAALGQFAERGFYGASIAQIAGELELTKQALLYYFKRKEDLYAEVLRRISERLMAALRSSVDRDKTPAQRFEDMILGVYKVSCAHPMGTRVLMRELLENQERAEKAESWYLRPFLDQIVETLDEVEGLSALPRWRKFAGIYQILGAIEYFAISRPTLTRMYGAAEFDAIRAAYPDELRGQVRRLIAWGRGG